MDLYLIRDEEAPDHTFGTLHVANLVLQTIELPWVPDPGGAPCGHPDTSCVPLGKYELVRHSSLKHPQTFALVNPELRILHEPGDLPEVDTARWGCLIHPDNVTATLLGCIGPGLSRGLLDGKPAVLQSRVAFEQLMAAVPWVDGHTLTIETVKQ
jgi:hypothetical protein